jgi:hypothetical protein
MTPTLIRPICLALWLALPYAAGAQTPDAATTTAPPTLSELTPVTTPPPTPVLEGCRTLTDKAMAADMKAVTAQSQKAELAEQDRLFEVSVAGWTQALAQCDGRAKERAQRNLADSQKTRASLSEQLGAGPQCTAAHKDATALQDMARQALSERRWAEASVLFHKAEDMWDSASERCTGSQQEVAIRRREQSEIDSQNAEVCAPLFDKAREQTQKFRASANGLSREEKLDASMVAETLWRDAASQCKGAATQDPARNNAQALARERGTPWVARVAPASQPVVAVKKPEAATTPVTTAVLTTVAVNVTPLSAAAGTTATSVTTTGGTLAAMFTSLGSTVTTRAAAASTPVSAEFSADTTRFSGQFVRDAEGNTYSGTGKVVWASGDVYEGPMVKGQRHGKGLFVWANGQRYHGDWVNDKPTGQASVQFVNGNQFDGSVVEGAPNGQGSLHFASGETYVGNTVNGLPHGQGTFHWPQGDQYTGQWQAGKKHGQGTFTWKSGDRWEGIYDNDQQVSQ